DPVARKRLTAEHPTGLIRPALQIRRLDVREIVAGDVVSPQLHAVAGRQRHGLLREVPAPKVERVVPEAVAAGGTARLHARPDRAVVEVKGEARVPDAVHRVTEIGTVQAGSLLCVRV